MSSKEEADSGDGDNFAASHRPKKTTPPRGRPRSEGRPEVSKSGGRDRSPRSACDFCHNKRVKCVVLEGRGRCEQCHNRDAVCVFSLKGKTGPKPKSNKGRVLASKLTKIPLRHRGSSQKDSSNQSTAGAAASACQSCPSAVPATATSPSAVGQEWAYLNTYTSTVGQLLPLIPEEKLHAALSERQRIRSVMAVAQGGSRLALEQAQVVGAIAIGALIRGDVVAGERYSKALVYHLGDVVRNTEPMAAPALGMMALYWLHQGQNALKLQWLEHVHRALRNSHVPDDLILCIEYLDYAREARPRPGMNALGPTRRALHTLSCLLANMSVIVNPTLGRAKALEFCEELGACISSLESKARVQLPMLFCKTMRALLLVMLGRVELAMVSLASLPSLVEDADGRNPAVARALPLSWDTLLIAGSLSFLLGQRDVYRRLRAVVLVANEVPPSARWSFCLPDAEYDVRAYVSHKCKSLNNICTIMREIADKTNYGKKPFYAEYDKHVLLAAQCREFDTVGLFPRLPAHFMPPNLEVQDDSGHNFGYGAGGMAMRVPHPSSREGSGDGRRPPQADTACNTPDAPKRRKTMPGGGYEASEGRTDSNSSPQSTAVATGRENPYSSNSGTREYVPRFIFDADDSGLRSEGPGLTKGLHNMSLTRLSVVQPNGYLSNGLHEPQGPLGRVPSEGTFDLGSTLGSFSLPNTEYESPDGGARNDGDSAGSSGARLQRRLSSFWKISKGLFSPSSWAQLSNISRPDGLGQSPGSMGGSDLGQDIVMVGDDFLEHNDLCGNSFLGTEPISANAGDAEKKSLAKRLETDVGRRDVCGSPVCGHASMVPSVIPALGKRRAEQISQAGDMRENKGCGGRDIKKIQAPNADTRNVDVQLRQAETHVSGP